MNRSGLRRGDIRVSGTVSPRGASLKVGRGKSGAALAWHARGRAPSEGRERAPLRRGGLPAGVGRGSFPPLQLPRRASANRSIETGSPARYFVGGAAFAVL